MTVAQKPEHDPLRPEALRRRYERIRGQRGAWEALWQDCYDYSLPARRPGGLSGGLGGGGNASRVNERLFDATAADAAEQLAATLLAQLTPPWSRWFAFRPGRDVPQENHGAMAGELDRAAELLQAQFDRSNLAVELHQAMLDLVVAGTACLACEEAPLGEASAFRFSAVPLNDLALDESGSGRLDIVFRRQELTLEQLGQRYPVLEQQAWFTTRRQREPDARLGLLDCLLPAPAPQYGYLFATVLEDGALNEDASLLGAGRFEQPPFIAFRWLKAPGEVYGRSPVMKALPDIKTANKVVELVLKNASIAVTGIWQADDDGVLNPANVKLVPGAIIPKAVGSSGLTPLAAPGRFDISQIVLDDLRARIRHALLADRLGQIDAPRMTATEVMERAAEMARQLGATFGRLQSELLTPLVLRSVAILQRRGEIPRFALDGREVALVQQSPLARLQAQGDVQSVLTWLQQLQALGPAALQVVDTVAVARWLGRTLGVPGEFLIEAGEAPAGGGAALPQQLAQTLTGAAPQLQQMLQQLAGAQQTTGAVQ
ncbi:MAG: portal protein [Ferrovibrio sp.]|uniref:portal protein n=1 Tax=Ferrovibrio sp. TaxID=1917215 RepID=UPI0026385B46|nr:portal protein [Ferrovibrio sp.]MCW0234670.1 portal protein [Ferrovibrio sp.]